MVRSTNHDSLFGALSRVVARHDGDGARLTLTEVALQAGVSRATANRDLKFLAALKHAAAAVAASNTRRGPSARRELVRDLRRTIDDMANVIQALSLSYEKLEKELGQLKGERVSPAAVPHRRLGGRASRG